MTDQPLTSIKPRARVLVVDDSATIRSYHAEILAGAGFIVETAENGYEALEFSLATAYDLFVIDVNMPRMDGCTLVATLRNQVHTPAPIVVISTETGGDADRAYAVGANLYLVKPVAAAVLLSCVGALTGSLPGVLS